MSRALLILRNLAFYPVFYLGSIVITLTALAVAPFSTPKFRKVVRFWSRFHRWCVTDILRCPVRFEGAPVDGAVLYAIKHESFFEAIDMPCLLNTPSVFAKQELFTIPGWGPAARAYGLVPVARDAGARALMAMIREARGLAAEGRPLVIFPEGSRVEHGVRAPLRSGFAGLYKALKLPVVPVAVNSGPAYHRFWKEAHPITYRFGETIPAGLDRAEIESRVTDAINALNDRQ